MRLPPFCFPSEAGKPDRLKEICIALTEVKKIIRIARASLTKGGSPDGRPEEAIGS